MQCTVDYGWFLLGGGTAHEPWWMIPSQLPEQLVTTGFLTDFKKPAKNVTYTYQMTT